MCLAVSRTRHSAIKRYAVKGEGCLVIYAAEAFRLLDVHMEYSIAVSNCVGNFSLVLFKNRGEYHITAIVTDAQHFHKGKVQPACSTGKHRSNVFAGGHVVVLSTETWVALGMVWVFHSLIWINGIHSEERCFCQFCCQCIV